MRAPVHLHGTMKIPLRCLVAGLTAAAACSGMSSRCTVYDREALVGQWRYAGKSGSDRSASAVEAERPARLEFRADRTFTAVYDSPAPPNVASGTLIGTWIGGRDCPGSPFLSATEVELAPRIPRASWIRIEGNHLVLIGATSGFADARYERPDRPAPSETASGSPVAAEPEATPSAAAATPTAGYREPTPNPWRGRH